MERDPFHQASDDVTFHLIKVVVPDLRSSLQDEHDRLRFWDARVDGLDTVPVSIDVVKS